jgi:putative ATP-binding cassette transporter
MATDPHARPLLGIFWRTAHGFWKGLTWRRAWLLTALVLTLVLVQLFLQYQINVWNRHLFDALEQKNAPEVLRQATIYVPLLVASVVAAIFSVFSRMTLQRNWRAWLTTHLIDTWLAKGRYYHLQLLEGDHKNPEQRLSEDARLATDAPVDFVAGILSAVLSAATFVFVLWAIGGSLDITIGGTDLHIPGFLVIAAVIYAAFGTGSMLVFGRSFIRISEANNQREAEFRYSLTRLSEYGESIALLDGEKEERSELLRTLGRVLDSWRLMMGQWMRTTFVSQTSGYVAGVLPVLLCAPKYLAGDMTLGQVMQAASAFVIVQSAFGWLVDNYPRFATWSANARRVASLVASINALEQAEKTGGIKLIERAQHQDKILQIRGLSVRLDDGTGLIHEAEVDIGPGERVLIVGESGTGKSTLVRAIAGLWPWGEGQIIMQQKSKLLMLPQRAYIPLGSLRRAAIYPLPQDSIAPEEVVTALESVGLGHLTDRLEEEAPWEHTLSGGEKQRLAIARLLLHKPDLIVLDEATSALDTESQERLMTLIHDRLPDATIISVGHRPELEAYHERKLVLKHQTGGARLIGDEYLTFRPGDRVRMFRRLFARRRATE